MFHPSARLIGCVPSRPSLGVEPMTFRFRIKLLKFIPLWCYPMVLAFNVMPLQYPSPNMNSTGHDVSATRIQGIHFQNKLLL